MKNELLKIKKYYGEEMMHLCAKLFPTILEKEGLLFEILKNNFAYSKFLYQDIINQKKIESFQNYILSFIEKNKSLVISNKDPFTLMEEAGYDLYFCEKEEDVTKFIKYYQPIERICTFYSHRTYDHYVFFAIKKNVESIKRENFKNPKRDDEYGTSVISIQFTKGRINNLSIKNRYNHVVDNSDATFSNNLDNIIPGLTDSFQKHFNLNIFPEDNNFELSGYCRGKDSKLYKYNYEFEDVYYCINNTIIDHGKVKQFENEKYLIADYFIIDLVNKEIKLYGDLIGNDAFILNKEIKKIEVFNRSNGKEVKIIGDNFYINLILNKFNQIIGYESNIKKIDDEFLFYNKTLKSFVDYELESIGSEFMPLNDTLVNLVAPNVRQIDDNFLEENTTLEYIQLPNIKEVGNNFLKNVTIKQLSFPNLEVIGNGFLAYNKFLERINLPNVKIVGNFFMYCNTFLTEINFPNLEVVGSCFLSHNYRINKVIMPKLKFIKDEFLANNEALINLELPSARDIGKRFLYNNQDLKTLILPNVVTIDDNFLNFNLCLIEFIAPNLLSVGDNFLANNCCLDSISLESLENVGDSFIQSNNCISKVDLPKLEIFGHYFLYSVRNLSNYYIPLLKEAHSNFSSHKQSEKYTKRLVKK